MDILDILKQTNALLTDDHFVYTSGKHGAIYINKDMLYIHPDKASEVGKMFAEHVKDLDVDVVAAPALGGIVLSQWTAFHLSKLKNKDVMAVYTEKTPEKDQIFTRGYDKIVEGKNVFVVEDLVTTGGSVKKVIASVRNVGSNVVVAGVMVDRSPDDAPVTQQTLDAPFFALGRLPVTVYDADDCPLCRQGVPINMSVGHGKKLLAQK
jgi:orotate phosphoribosyltransferase